MGVLHDWTSQVSSSICRVCVNCHEGLANCLWLLLTAAMCDATSGIMSNANCDGPGTGTGPGPAHSDELGQQAAALALAAPGRFLHPTRFLIKDGPMPNLPQVTLLGNHSGDRSF